MNLFRANTQIFHDYLIMQKYLSLAQRKYCDYIRVTFNQLEVEAYFCSTSQDLLLNSHVAGLVSEFKNNLLSSSCNWTVSEFPQIAYNTVLCFNGSLLLLICKHKCRSPVHCRRSKLEVHVKQPHGQLFFRVQKQVSFDNQAILNTTPRLLLKSLEDYIKLYLASMVWYHH